MKKVINVEPGEVFARLAAGEEVYTIDMANDELIDLSYESVCAILTRLRSESYVYFIVEKDAEVVKEEAET